MAFGLCEKAGAPRDGLSAVPRGALRHVSVALPRGAILHVRENDSEVGVFHRYSKPK